MSLTPQPIRLVLYEGPGTESLADQDRFAAVRSLLEHGQAVTRAGHQRPLPPPDHAAIVVVGRFPDGTPPSADQATSGTPIRWQSLPADPTELPGQLETHRAALDAPALPPWTPWFPVIDYDRCTNCMQCLSFCLFGVYGVDEEKHIQVQNQDQCKTLCPACSRVCPEAAIIFPKYKAGPINGDLVTEADLQREKMKVDISSLLGGDIYAMLRARSERSRSRFSKERDADQALNERQKCLQKLGELAAGIPPEVLRSLPSPEEIARKAAEAAARVATARAGTPTNPSTT